MVHTDQKQGKEAPKVTRFATSQTNHDVIIGKLDNNFFVRHEQKSFRITGSVGNGRKDCVHIETGQACSVIQSITLGAISL